MKRPPLTPRPRGKRDNGRPPIGLYPNLSRTLVASQLGISPQQISRILLGQRKCPMALGIRLARILSISFDRLDIQLRTAQDRAFRVSQKAKRQQATGNQP